MHHHTCSHCNYDWWSRVEQPVKCPQCQRRWPSGKPEKGN